MSDYEIVKLWEDPEVGFWRAIVRSRGVDVELCDEHGSWQTPPLDDAGRRREALPRVAHDLQRLRRHRLAAEDGAGEQRRRARR
jgi:hypothetical protein